MAEGMTVNFDGLRRQLINNFNSLCKKLNAAIQDKDFNPSLVLEDPEDIEKEMESLRSMIATLACMYDNENKTFKELEDFDLEVYNWED